MPKNILLYGGYNWFGFEMIDVLLTENSFTNFIVVDSFQNQLWKDNIKEKFDRYRYLYEENIFLFSIDIKDKYKLEDIYKTYQITHVVNNIKYNTNDVYMMEKVNGYHNIAQLNKQYNINTYICLYRNISHNSFGLNHDKSDHVTICETFNQCIKKANEALHDHMNFHEIDIYDYVFGPKKDKYNDIVAMYKNIIRCKSPCYIQKCSFYAQYDKDVIQFVEDLLLDHIPIEIPLRSYPYINLFETIYYHMTRDNRDEEKIITDDDKLLAYICD